MFERSYIVRDRNGSEWARFCYSAQANAVADRCNTDRALRERAPFTVRPDPMPYAGMRSANTDYWG